MDKEILSAETAKSCYDVIVEIEKNNWSISEAFTKHGFNLKNIVEPVMAEMELIKNGAEASDLLDVETVKKDYNLK